MDSQREWVESADEALGNISGGRVLDVATGSGGFITFLLDNIRDFTDITGIDNNENRLEAARKAFVQENIHFVCMDAVRMDFPDNHFDTVCIANSLHHMEDLVKVLYEMKRVCKPDGNFIISEMYRDRQSETQMTHVCLHHWWAAVDMATGILHHKTYTRQEVIKITKKVSLRSLMYYDLKDLETDPMDPQLIQQLDDIIDRYIERAKTIRQSTELCKQGTEIRQRVHEVGFHAATTLLVIGKK